MTVQQHRSPLHEGEPPLALEGRLLTLKHGDMFAVFDEHGDILGAVERTGGRGSADGLFQDDTRILSRFRMTAGGAAPEVLGTSISADNTLLTIDLTTPDLIDDQGRPVARGHIHIRRRRYLWHRTLHEAMVVRNHGGEACRLTLAIEFAADFLDLFEVRGSRRAARGSALAARFADRSIILSYEGLDGGRTSTSLSFSRTPHDRSERSAAFTLDLPPGRAEELLLTIAASDQPAPAPERRAFYQGLKAAKRSMRRCSRRLRKVGTSSEMFDEWLERAGADLALLTTQLETGPYPYAGIPWFSVPFGRDAIITALQTLWLDPTLARGVLSYLAGHQATELSSFRDSAPGKIMHEARRGEMSRLDEVPFRCYFGGVDTTPLFVMLAGAYHRRTGDLDTIRSLWPAIRKALAWIDGACQSSGGFLTYQRGEESGLQNQGWKDSHDSVFHADGSLATGPIALVEAQGYVFAARLAAAELAEALGEPRTAAAHRRAAEDLRRRVEDAFWCEDLSTYALALDGSGTPCRVRSSNAGHLLYCGLPRGARSRAVMEAMMARDMFSGWGIRTVAEGAARYNPMSYHNGAVWPHDTALVGAGLARYGRADAAARVLGAMFDAARHFSGLRLPELFCGFRRRSGEAPAAYPSACVPQAWASGAPFMLLQACLGLEVDAVTQEVRVTKPALPGFLDEVHITGLPIGPGRADLRVQRLPGHAYAVHVDRADACRVISR